MENIVRRIKGIWKSSDASNGQLNCETGSDQIEQERFDWLGPPNLQLGLSSNQFEQRYVKKRYEVFLAAVTAVLLQIGLIAIATITVFHQRTRRAIASEPKEYGYPCYIISSVLLSIGIGICSLAVERNTIEHSWRVLQNVQQKKELESSSSLTIDQSESFDSSPRLVWLQQTQDVNDQAFDGYAILAGPKRYIVTSSRIEDTEKANRKYNSSARADLKTSSRTDESEPSQTSTDHDKIVCLTYAQTGRC